MTPTFPGALVDTTNEQLVPRPLSYKTRIAAACDADVGPHLQPHLSVTVPSIPSPPALQPSSPSACGHRSVSQSTRLALPPLRLPRPWSSIA